MDASSQESLIKAVRRLTWAVWTLSGVLAVFVAMYLGAYIPYVTIGSDSTEAPPSEVPSTAPPAFVDRFEKFYELPIEQQIRAASVIALAKYQREGDRMKCVITELLKQAPDTKFYYGVGDEYRQCSHRSKPGEDRGDGQIMFFAGNPAQFRFSSSFRGDRLTGLGDMPIDLLRKEIKNAQ